MQFQSGRCGWVSGQEVDFYIESHFFSLASVLLVQRYLAGTTSQPAAKEWSRTSASAGSMHVSNCAQIPIFHNRDGSTFTPTSVTSPPCGGRPLNIDSCSCPNGNTITANNFIAAAVPLIQDILSGWVFEPMSHALCFYNTLIDPRNVKLLLFTMTSTTPINGRLYSRNEGACGTNSEFITLMYSPTNKYYLCTLSGVAPKK